jgi:hypothetical protein
MLPEKIYFLAVKQSLICAAFFDFAMGWLCPGGDVGMQ